jgi:hypothetical protein
MLYVCFLVGASYPCPMGNQGGYRSKGPCVLGEMDRKGVGVETPSEANQSILTFILNSLIFYLLDFYLIVIHNQI